MLMTPSDEDETLAIFKASAPVLLLFWVKNYDLVKLSRGPVVICCILSALAYIGMLMDPLVEKAVWA